MEKYSSYKDSGVQWLGQIPSHWEVLALKHILKFKKVLVRHNATKYDLLSLTLQGVIKRDMDDPQGKFPSSFDTYQEVNPGDFIFCNFDNEETPRAVGLSPYYGMITGAYDVLYRKNQAFSDKFLIYYFLYIDDAKRFKPLYKGLRKTVPFDSFMSYKIPVPPIREQDAMVAYLDAATTKIDEAIAQQQRLIDLLNERKQIIINDSVSSGLGNYFSPLTSFEGRESITIPKGWRLIPLKAKISFVNGYAFDSESFEKEGEVPVIRISNISDGSVSYDDIVYVDKDKGLEPFLTKEGDLLIAMSGATTGKVGFDIGGGSYINQRVGIIRSSCQKWIYYWLMTSFFKEYVYLSALGSAQPNISSSGIKNFRILYPENGNYSKIVDRLDVICQGIDKALGAFQHQVDLLKERKQIIINDLVTGKVKVD